MTIFDAVLTEIRGHRAAELRFRVNEKDHRPRRVLLIEQARQTFTAALPFVWRFTHEAPYRSAADFLTGEGAPVLTVVAAPGVTVERHGFPEKEGWLAREGLPWVNVYRVQDPAVLPRLASDTPSVHLVGTYEIADHPVTVQLPPEGPGGPPRTGTLTFAPQRHFIVEQLPSAVVITHVGSGDQWTIRVPVTADDPNTSTDALARYAFEIDIDAGEGDPNGPMLKIVTTPDAEVTVMERAVYARWFGQDLNPQPIQRVYWKRWEVDYIHQVPAQGTPIEPGPDWRYRNWVTRVPNRQEQVLALEQTLIDVAVGFIPIVGDAVDIAEFIHGVITGEDKWGNPLSTGELAMLGLAAVVPFVSGALVRAGGRLVQRFAEHADEAADLAQRVKQAGLNAADVDVIRRFEALVKAGRHPPPELWNQALTILRRIPGRQPTIGVLLNAGGTGFAHTELQAAYQRYVSTQGRKGLKAADAADWARLTRGRPRELLTTLLGPDFARRVAGVEARPLNLLDIPRPATLTDKLLEAHRDTAFRSNRLWERLGRLLDEPQQAGAVSLGVLRRQVSPGHFRIMKGNLAEIFSLPIQHAELARIAKEHPGALLVSGVRVRLMRDGKLSASKLFSDNIIITKKGNQVRVLAVFEVKSGFKGGEEAAEQIFEWIENRFTTGSQLVLPKGSTLTSARRRTWTIKKELSFTWKPSDANVPMVTGLASAGERHLITARGSSALGIDSGIGVGAEVIPHRLPQTSAELDYLTGTILSRDRPNMP